MIKDSTNTFRWFAQSIDENGQTITLGGGFSPRRPVILALGCYHCTMICSQELQGLVRALSAVPFRAASDYSVVAISSGDGETAQEAATGSPDGCHLPPPMIHAVAQVVGFRYSQIATRDGGRVQCAHPSALEVATGPIGTRTPGAWVPPYSTNS